MISSLVLLRTSVKRPYRFGVHVPFLDGAVSGAREVEGGREDATELPSLPITINCVGWISLFLLSHEILFD
jgi:hypothetical protein